MFFSLAKKLCEKSGHKQHHHGVIVIVGGAIVATGFNHSVKHAEIVALSKLWPSERRKAKVYSYRWGHQNKFALAKPCGRCENYMRENGIKTVWFTNKDGNLEKMRL